MSKLPEFSYPVCSVCREDSYSVAEDGVSFVCSICGHIMTREEKQNILDYLDSLPR